MRRSLCVLALCAAVSVPAFAQTTAGSVGEYPINYPNVADETTGMCHPKPGGSTHEITFRPGNTTLWITGQNYDQVVQVAESGAMAFHRMPTGSGPHGIQFDAAGRLWVTLEKTGQIVRLDANGTIMQTIDVNLACATCAAGQKLNPKPHGLAIGADGATLWFTGKATGTVGRVAPDGTITTYVLPTVGSVPIYVSAGKGGTMWVTELVGNAIARIDPNGVVTESPIPTNNSRPIAIVPQPDDSGVMWFTEEAGNRVASITPDGKIVEYPLPLSQSNVILAGLGFDKNGNLWVQQYVDQNNPTPANPSPSGGDYIIRIDKSITQAKGGDISKVPIAYFKVPSVQTIMHRVIEGPDGNIWFTELGTNRVGKLTITQ
ncbi:MAG TPA: SMP-30/gluconolactonase/LRE family protein [Thermoanaerobaculia bacterium]|nr:SMP-30/gluconolactonase/LRE family protein [Thermoanaerobaculia bacterium]